jgi:MerR family transcriptional regulator/heat shock protein HspR
MSRRSVDSARVARRVGGARRDQAKSGYELFELSLHDFRIRVDDVRERCRRVVDRANRYHGISPPNLSSTACPGPGKRDRDPERYGSLDAYFVHLGLTKCKPEDQTLAMSSTSRSRPVYSMGVAAELLELPPATLRLYERKGLIVPARTEGGTRRYSADDIDQMRRIADLQADGVNLAGIGRVMGLEDENAELRATLDARRPLQVTSGA